MPKAERENERIVLRLLSSVESDGTRSQRHIAAELGIALGLVNVYRKRCVKNGLIKVSDAPAWRHPYYLIPTGFAEKSRLTVRYVSDAFSFFRLAKDDSTRVFEQAKANSYRELLLAGKSDLAEIAILCAVESGIDIVAVIDPQSEEARFLGIDVCKTYCDVKVCSMRRWSQTFCNQRWRSRGRLKLAASNEF
jgi:hypothetical protein